MEDFVGNGYLEQALLLIIVTDNRFKRAL
ncbi:hypothetical protein JL09_g6577 [Pichia kudriavzevii]|uniref:Uncharacterized protein n=1 Tax=Pichia kudriavzevii TaxID=4909 RepID=A0A099NQS8_PICKU|nr:hypothetical protein JL09_g6577 [Pichia kudriavzevii]